MRSAAMAAFHRRGKSHSGLTAETHYIPPLIPMPKIHRMTQNPGCRFTLSLKRKYHGKHWIYLGRKTCDVLLRAYQRRGEKQTPGTTLRYMSFRPIQTHTAACLTVAGFRVYVRGSTMPNSLHNRIPTVLGFTAQGTTRNGNTAPVFLFRYPGFLSR